MKIFVAALIPLALAGAEKHKTLQPAFQTSDRCFACHNGMQTKAGEDVSIGFDWRSSMMANSSRDPYWQAGVRREIMDHPEAKEEIEDECSACHMPMTRYNAKVKGKKGGVFEHLPFNPGEQSGREAADGVSCSVCHQIGKEKLGTRESFNAGFTIEAPDAFDNRPEYGPFEIEKGQTRIMRSSSEGYRPIKSDHIRQSELCATCHTLYTKALGAGGKVVGELPEQMIYQEWLNSEFKDKQSCQSCHMPLIKEDVPVTKVLGVPREGVSRHVFVGANFFMQRMLNKFRADLAVWALPNELSGAADNTVRFLESQAAKVSIAPLTVVGGKLETEISVENNSGHKLPTAYPSRRAWLHIVVRDAANKTVFESGALRADGFIEGNDNDADAEKIEPHYAVIDNASQVQIYESLMVGENGRLTTGLLSAVRFVKDNRLLPRGFDKAGASKDIAVVGEAAGDRDFLGGGDKLRLSIPTGAAQGPFTVEAELLYQPIGYRWANNLKKYDAMEPKRFTGYYDAMSGATAARLAAGERRQ